MRWQALKRVLIQFLNIPSPSSEWYCVPVLGARAYKERPLGTTRYMHTEVTQQFEMYEDVANNSVSVGRCDAVQGGRWRLGVQPLGQPHLCQLPDTGRP